MYEKLKNFVYKSIVFKCINYGATREHKKESYCAKSTVVIKKREITKSNCIECEFFIRVNFDMKSECFRVTTYKQQQAQHSISEDHYINHTYNRRLSKEELQFVIKSKCLFNEFSN